MLSPDSNRVRRARVTALAKINLALQVLDRRPDGYHELRTVFQTISLPDTIAVEYRPGGGTIAAISDANVPIPNNIVPLAARMLMEEAGIRGEVRFGIDKRIPMGAGLGGGSSDAAAVLLALPVLAGRRVPIERLLEIAARLGSDVPFFLMGGTALGMGRGEELYPFPEPKTSHGLLVTPDVHVSTSDAYRALGRDLTAGGGSLRMNIFQWLSWEVGEGLPVPSWRDFCRNDFEEVVFRQHPQLQRLRRKLERAGASPARMSGSGSALFGFFAGRKEAERAAEFFPKTRTEVFRTIHRAQYRALWWKSLEAHISGSTWPPQSRYAKWASTD
ncbi:MAG: 4-(cytidine 5'-diphospho)-2-C-methyl-D-erythritol kinase [Acidobacteria bacterium]|nr:4-(cytidine 5'-diphospho)-2-C-methyl-D-erythritol kinase [Acidobacteriota bacterium]